MPWLRHLAVLFAFVAAFARPAPASALSPASPETRVGGFEVAAHLLVSDLGAANREQHQGIGAAYDENASGYRFAVEGTATVFEYAGANGKHFSVLVRAGDDVLHTHLAGGLGTETFVQDATGLGLPLIKEVHFNLPDAAAALQYQRNVLNQSQGMYNSIANNCAQHCANVLNHGGMNVPLRTGQLMAWWRKVAR